MNSWPPAQQVLVGSWQQIPGIAATQRPVQQPFLADTLAPQALPENFRQSILLDSFDPSLASLQVSCRKLIKKKIDFTILVQALLRNCIRIGRLLL